MLQLIDTTIMWYIHLHIKLTIRNYIYQPKMWLVPLCSINYITYIMAFPSNVDCLYTANICAVISYITFTKMRA